MHGMKPLPLNYFSTSSLNLLLSVDDIYITGNDPEFSQCLITHLGTCFDIRDLGSSYYFLGLEIQASSDSVTITKQKHLQDLLVKAKM